MKRKFTKILGVMLPVAMILALAVSLLPVSSPPTVKANPGALRFETVTIPKIGAAGKYVLTPGSNVGAIAGSGTVLFAAADITTSGNVTDLLKSTDGGATWSLQAAFKTAATANGDTSTTIVAIKLSPDYATESTLFVATGRAVYQTVDGGTSFTAMTAAWAAGETITDMDVSLDKNKREAIIVGTTGAGNIGEVYVYAPATTGMAWKAQLIGADYNVLAVAFSPTFTNDEGIFAVSVNATTPRTRVSASFGNTQDGGGWGDSVGHATLRGTVVGTANANATRARIAFPDDFNADSLGSNFAFVGTVAGDASGETEPTGATGVGGDLYKVVFQPTLSSAIDLNVRGTIGTQQTGTNVYSLDVSGDAAAASIVVGTDMWSTAVTNYYWLTYYSTNSGTSWSTPRESQPTGGDPTRDANGLLISGAATRPNVLLSGDFAKSGLAYFATAGTGTSGLSRTNDGGKSWRQISLVDWGTTTYRVSEQDAISDQKFYLRFESGSTNITNDSYWLTTNGGAQYERLVSYANPSMPIEFDGMDVTGANKDVVFVKNNSVGGAGKYWRSTDGGATFPRTITAKAVIVEDSVRDENSIITAHAGGALWYTSNLGRPWTEPDESIMSGTPGGISVSGDLWLVRMTSGVIYVSNDAGKNFKETLSSGDLGTHTRITFDTNFSKNNFIYGIVTGTGATHGIYRIIFNKADPDSTAWKRIDNTSTGFAGVSHGTTTFISSGVMYNVDGAAVTVSDNSGGLWRSTNPEEDIDGLYPPVFVKENNGLDAGATVAYSARTTVSSGQMIFVRNSAVRDVAASYFNQLLSFTDTLNKSADQIAPADKATNAGVSLNTEDLTMTAILSWKAKAGATGYQYQVARDKDFLSVVASGNTDANEVRVDQRVTGETYYWRVRVAGGTVTVPIGAPLVSPWSATRTFSVGQAFELQFKVTSPAIGATGVAVEPTFTWTPAAGALGYEVVVAEDATFAILDTAFTTDTNFGKTAEALAYDTTYYWRVRPITGPTTKVGQAMVTPVGAWISGIFTTMAEPVAPTPPVVITPPAAPVAPEIKVVEVPMPTPPPPIPTGLLYTIVGIGAILVIALIVLIVRTRRVA